MPRFKVSAGPSIDSLVTITHKVSTQTPHSIASDAWEGEVLLNIKGFEGRESAYFEREDKRDITWSIQVQGRFLQSHNSDEILFGNVFDHPLSLPWGFGAATKFMSYVDPTMEQELGSATRPWAFSPLISTMPQLVQTTVDAAPTFPAAESIREDASKLNFKTGAERRAHFASAQKRKEVVFGPQDVITADFCYGYIQFDESLSLRLPGGIGFDLMKHWDGQPVRFICCERASGKDGKPFGRVFWCICVELDEDVDEEEGEGERAKDGKKAVEVEKVYEDNSADID